MKLNKIKTFFSSLLLASTLSACSKPDVTGVWIPETIAADDSTYKYYEIKKIEGTERLQFIEYYYRILPLTKGDKIPRQLDQPTTKVLEFTKDKTYCVEGSLNTECVVAIDSDKLDIYQKGRFKKSASNPPKIPINKMGDI